MTLQQCMGLSEHQTFLVLRTCKVVFAAVSIRSNNDQHMSAWHGSCMACAGRKGKRSALVDHQTKNKEHKQLVQDMELGLKRVMLVGGVAQRLLGKVAIITGGSASDIVMAATVGITAEGPLQAAAVSL